MELLTCAQTMSRHEGSVTALTIARGSIYSAAVDGSIKVYIVQVCFTIFTFTQHCMDNWTGLGLYILVLILLFM